MYSFTPSKGGYVNYYCVVNDGITSETVYFNGNITAFEISNREILVNGQEEDEDRGIKVGDTVEMSFDATKIGSSSDKLTYTWKKSYYSGGTSNQETLDSFTTNKCTVKTDKGGSYSYTCTVSDGVSSQDVYFSIDVTTITNAKSVIKVTDKNNKVTTYEDYDETVTVGLDDTVELSVSADTSTGNDLTYSWSTYSDGETTELGKDKTLTLTKNPGNYDIYCYVSDGEDSKEVYFCVDRTSITYRRSSTINGEKTDERYLSALFSDEVVLKVDAKTSLDGGTLTYKWYRIIGDESSEEIENATSELYSVPNEMLASNKGNELCYKCQFSDGKSTENVWFDVEVGLVDLSQTITVNGKAVEENDDGYYVVDRSDKPVLGFSINDGNSYKYQWSKYSNKEEEYIEIKSGTTSTGADASLALEDSTYDDYRLRLTDSDGNYDNWYYNLKFTDPVPVTYVSLSQDTLSLDTGKTGQLTAIVAPADAANTNVTWTSSDESVATVDEYGEVTAVKAGTATITVTTEDGGKTATCQVTVNDPKSDTISVIAVSLSKYEISLKPGESDTLKATLAPSNASNQNVKWTSSNTSVATVDKDGKVTAVKAGSATITVATEDGGKIATCDVTVKDSEVLVSKITVDPTAVSLETGDIKQLTASVAPENATDTSIIWTSSDKNVATVDGNGNVKALKAGTATITAKANDGSNVSATCVVTVKDKAVTPEQPSTTTTTVTPPTTAVVDPAPVGTPATIGKISYVVTGPNSVKLVKNLNKKAKKVTVPATVNVNGKVLPVTEIGNNAFKNNKKLTSVVIGPNVTKIGKNVFKGCKSLKKITVKTKKLNSTSIKNLAKSVKFRGAKLTVKVPKAKKKAYKKIFKKSAKKVKIK